MKVQDLVKFLGESVRYEYTGDKSANFKGLEIRGHNSVVRGRFFLLTDENWPSSIQQMFRESRRGDILYRVKQALKKGAAGIVLPRKVCDQEMLTVLDGENVFFVDDTHAFAWETVKAVRVITDECYITAITGAVGKSTTQQMLAHALRNVESGAMLVPGNNQNTYSSMVWQLTNLEGKKHVVLEVAGGAVSRVRKSGYDIGADISVVTSIAEVHIRKNETLKDIAIRKAAIFDGERLGATAIINIDTPYSKLLIRRAYRSGRQVITYGESPEAAIRLISYDSIANHATVQIGKENFTYKLGAPGKHMAINSLAVIAVLRSYRIKNWREGVDSLATFRALDGRGKTTEVIIDEDTRVTLINEAYNANPASMRSSIETLASYTVQKNQRRVAILGDMLELGDHSRTAHEELASKLEEAKLDAVFLFGEEMKALKECLPKDESKYVYWDSFDTMVSSLPSNLQEGDLVLAKASRGTGLFSWLNQLKKIE